MDALRFLKHCHRKLNHLFTRSNRINAFDQKRRIFKKIKKALLAHSRIEQGIFYPAIESREQLDRLVLESNKKHRHVQVLVRGIDALLSENKPCDPEVKILQETVSKWNEDEEQKLFPRVRELLDRDTLNALGKQFERAIGREPPHSATFSHQ